MRNEQCPICFSVLEAREVAPCDDCGTTPRGLECFQQGKHEYHRMVVFPGLELTLCEFCKVDFSSYDPTYFGLPPGCRVHFDSMQFVQDVRDTPLVLDKVCPECGRRIGFLKFLAAARELHSR